MEHILISDLDLVNKEEIKLFDLREFVMKWILNEEKENENKNRLMLLEGHSAYGKSLLEDIWKSIFGKIILFLFGFHYTMNLKETRTY